MKAEYDFTKAKRNPYESRLTQRVAIRLNGRPVSYFKGLAEKTGINQAPINLDLRDRAESKREFNLDWRPGETSSV